jgi:ribosomal protein L37AE/L43A
MSAAIVTTCPQCKAMMHRRWTACVVCQTPTSSPSPAPVPPPQHQPPRREPPGRSVQTTHGRYAQPRQRDLEHLGPILPACPVCGALQYWHNHVTDVWACWACVPPHAQVPGTVEAA